MSEGITKEELKAMIETQAKATEQMVMIAGALKDISETNKKVLDKLSNGLGDAIAAKVAGKIAPGCEVAGGVLGRIETKVTTIEKDSLWVKIVVSAVALVSITVTVLVNTMASHTATARNKVITQDNIDILKKMEVVLENHLEQTKSDVVRQKEIDRQYKSIMEKK